MRIFIFLLIGLLSLFNPGMANDPESNLPGSQNSQPYFIEDKIDSIIQKSRSQMDYDIDSAISTILTAIDLTEQYNCSKLYNKSQYFLSLYLFLLGKNQESRLIIEEILPYYQASRSRWRLAILYNRLGRIHIHSANLDLARTYLQKAEKILIDLKKRGSQAMTNLYLSDLFTQKGEYGQSLQHSQKASELYRKEKNPDGISMALASTGDTYLIIKDYPLAITSYLQALANREKIVNQHVLLKPTMNLGIIAYQQGELNSAQNYLEETLFLIEKLGNSPYLPETYYYLGKLAEENGAIDEAFCYTRNAKTASIDISSLRLKFKAELRLAELYWMDGQENMTLKLAKGVYGWARKNNDFELLSTASNILAMYAEKKHSYKDAYLFRTQHQAAKDSVLNEEKIKEITANRLKYQYEKKEAAQMALQQIQEADFQNKLQRESLVKRILLLGIFLFSLLLILLVRSNYLRRKTMDQLQKKNETLRLTEQDLATKNQALEQYIDSNLQLENFAYMASHDLRAPLNTVLSFSQLLHKSAEDKLSLKEKDFVNFIVTGATHMDNLIQALLNFSQVDTEKLSLERIEISELLRQVQLSMQHIIDQKKPQIFVEAIPQVIQADWIKLTQLFQNLIENAIKFTPESQVPYIHIKGQEYVDRYQFSVSDRGIGIPREFQDRIFMIFKRLHSSDKFEGTGIGLALCKKIVEQHEGEIWVESLEGQGCTFHFTLKKFI
ncbi:MAG: ATP-binding protein [Bacteroidota bacterium]